MIKAKPMSQRITVFDDIFDPHAPTLVEVWQRKIKYADAAKMQEFVFKHEGDHWLSRWVKNRWTDPVLIEII